MYKLLSEYPAENLILVQTHVERLSGSSLKAAEIINLSAPPSWAGPRLRTLFDLLFVFAARFWLAWLKPRIRSFRPDAVVCVIHGWAAETALAVSLALHVPFHAIIHDAPEAALPAPRFLRGWRARRWRKLCLAAASRLCVSPYMAAEVQRMTGLATEVLYPGLAPDAKRSLDSVQDSEIEPKPYLTFAFAGLIHDGYVQPLLQLGHILKKRGHRLILHSPQANEFVTKYQPEATVDGGLLPVQLVASTLRKEADVCLLPMSFRQEDQANTRISFPSKLVEYCAAGRPVLIFAPSYSSIVRWAGEHSGFGIVVESDREEELEAAICQLESVEARQELGNTAKRLAEESFSHDATYGHFVRVISSVA
jgi:glycosyltransferase involved in cell wall biosynthesis